MKQIIRITLFAFALVCSATGASFAQVAETGVLAWTANTEADLAGYKVYQRSATGSYSTPVATLGRVTTYTASLPAPSLVSQPFFWVITAYDLAGNESARSSEVTKTIAAIDLPPTAPVGVTVR